LQDAETKHCASQDFTKVRSLKTAARAAKKQKLEKREAARVKKEESVCPEVIYQIEQFQADCAKLDKLTGSKICQKIPRTVSRDVRFTVA
jgi:hypothetical protein